MPPHSFIISEQSGMPPFFRARKTKNYFEGWYFKLVSKDGKDKRGIVVNVFLYLHFKAVFADDAAIPVAVWLLTLFMLWLSLAIAWLKTSPIWKVIRNIRSLS